MTEDLETILRRLAIRDDRYVESILASDEVACESELDARTRALARIGALIALDAAPPSYMEAVECARNAGATPTEVVGVLLAVVPLVGEARAVSAAPNLALALGYDVDRALEERSPA